MKARFVTGLLLFLMGVLPVHADTQYPEKGVRLVIPFAAGGSATTSARLLAEHLAQALGQKVYVENKGGANGAIGAAFVANSQADGYTLLYSSAGMMTVNPFLFGDALVYKVDQFIPVSLSSTFASVMFINKDFPAKNLQELIAYGKKNPGAITFGSAGAGSSGHLWGELLKQRADIDIRHVPYKGMGPALIDVIGGRITFVLDAAVTGISQLKAGNLRAIASTSHKRIPMLADVPTFAESGLKGFEPLSWYGVFAPAATPKPIIDRLNSAIAVVASSPEYKKDLMALGMSAEASTSEALKSRIVNDSKLWSEVIRVANLSSQ